MSETGTLTLQSVPAGLEFEARFNSAVIRFDSGPGHTLANPVQGLLAALAACEAMDVIEILRKKRQAMTAYEVAMRGERAATHPRRYTAIELVHRVTGRGVSRQAVADAVRLSEEKYCSVRASLAADLVITSAIEILEG